VGKEEGPCLMVTSVGTPTRFRRFFSNPIVGIVGSGASVIRLILAVIFYRQA